MDYKTISIEITKKYQSESGAYVACPTFDTYKYCWLRDGSFIAYSMDLCGEHESSKKYFDWVNNAITGISNDIKCLLKEIDNGAYVDTKKYPPARFELDGTTECSDWPNFQLDGYGIWLWALSEHILMNDIKQIPSQYMDNVLLIIEYLKKCWGHECYDCWEENGDKVHASTLGCIYGGLKAISKYLTDKSLNNTTNEIKLFITNYFTHNDSLVKFMDKDAVDANLLWLCIPFNVFSPLSSIMNNTVLKIENDLAHSHGVHRYSSDTYYGGGEWLLLSAWLGWYYSQTNRIDDAILQMEWIEEQADIKGQMPEQVLYHTNNPSKIKQWQDLWGNVASPLLWSHAMYLILDNAIAKNNKIE
jgi:GH15 family glucan-1,4-alpha-glucosidase